MTPNSKRPIQADENMKAKKVKEVEVDLEAFLMKLKKEHEREAETEERKLLERKKEHDAQLT